jgi:hypothetical protein
VPTSAGADPAVIIGSTVSTVGSDDESVDHRVEREVKRAGGLTAR